MRTIGVIGGMSWESTAVYYRLLNEEVKARLGGLHSADALLYSVDFAGIEELQREGDWDRAGEHLADAARRLQAGGAACIVLATNTMHRVAAAIEAATDLPFLHIGDATGKPIAEAGIRRVGLLATRYTMEQDFYRGRMRDRYGLDVLIPEEPQRTRVHEVIYEELCLGRIEPASRAAYRETMAELVDRGAEAIILGCTEITLLVDASDATVPLFDSTALHVRAAVDASLGGE